jgi:hypothetical protein
MAFYIHIGCELTGRAGSNFVVDRWLHQMPLSVRLKVMGIVTDL